MSLTYIIIEVRTNLHCANVFLQFDQSLTETEFMKIVVDSCTIRLKEYSTETSATIVDHFTIEAPTLSNLVVEEYNASFRISIVPSEVTTNEVETSSLQYIDTSPQISVGERYEFRCRNCESSLSSSDNLFEFQRILEFPSGSVDVGEFFCHHGPDFGPALVPGNNDLFYGFHFIILKTDNIRSQTKQKEGHLYCKRCLKYLGETLFDNMAASKLWTDGIYACKENSVGVRNIFPTDYSTTTSQLLKKIIRESITDPEESHLMQFTKVLIEATFPNRLRKYLMLNILEKNLDILRNIAPLAHGGLNKNVLHVKLDKCKCFKVLYKCEDERENELPLLTFWKTSFSTHSMKISSQLLTGFIEELEINTNLLPRKYRHSNGFTLSYVFY